MKIKISKISRVSKISRSKHDDKDLEDGISNFIKEKLNARESFLNYKLLDISSTSKLVFKNVDCLKELKKDFIDTFLVCFFSIGVFNLFLGFISSKIPYSNFQFEINTLGFLLIIVVIFLMALFMVLNKSNVPYILEFNGIYISEKNLLGQTISEFNLEIIQNINSEHFKNNLISLSVKGYFTSWRFLIILDDDEQKGSKLIDRHLKSLYFENTI